MAAETDLASTNAGPAPKALAAINLEKVPTFINLKCAPEKAEEPRARYPSIKPGYHMNKRHWNSIYLDGAYSPDDLHAWIDHSYELVVQNLKKADRESLDL